MRELTGVMDHANEVVRGVSIGLGSPGILDQQSWAAIIAGAPAAVGHLEMPIIKDVTNDIGYGEADFPVELDVGTVVRGQMFGINDSTGSLELTIAVWLEDSEGVSRGLAVNTWTIPPGEAISGVSEEIALDKGGSWILHGKLEG